MEKRICKRKEGEKLKRERVYRNEERVGLKERRGRNGKENVWMKGGGEIEARERERERERERVCIEMKERVGERERECIEMKRE